MSRRHRIGGGGHYRALYIGDLGMLPPGSRLVFT